MSNSLRHEMELVVEEDRNQYLTVVNVLGVGWLLPGRVISEVELRCLGRVMKCQELESTSCPIRLSCEDMRNSDSHAQAYNSHDNSTKHRCSFVDSREKGCKREEEWHKVDV